MFEATQEQLQVVDTETELDDVNDAGTEVDEDDDPLDDLCDLDVLLSESVAMNEKRKAANRKTGRFADDLPPLDLPIGPCWKTLSSHAIFTRHDCACGGQSTNFSHFAELQSYTAPAEGKPKRWVKVCDKPKALGDSYLIVVPVPYCTSCLALNPPTQELHRLQPKKDINEIILALEVLQNGPTEECDKECGKDCMPAGGSGCKSGLDSVVGA